MTNEVYLEYRFELQGEDQELAVAVLSEIGYEGFEQQYDALIGYVPKSVVSENAFPETLKDAFRSVNLMVPAFRVAEIQPQNWNAVFEASIEPLIVGPFYVRPEWRTEPAPAGQIELIITPKMAFGTGSHETTRLILEAFPKLITPGNSVLDVGTGTGILAIAAVRYGASSAYGFDIDEWSALNAKENAALNGVLESTTFVLGTFATLEGQLQPADVVFANLQRHIIVELQQKLVQSMRPHGKLVLSGILSHETDFIRELPAFAMLHETSRKTIGDWAMLILEKP
jgi:ribosomal protein L11 methyltransferase